MAWLAQYPIWAIAITGILISRGKARRVAGVSPRTLRQVLFDRSGSRRRKLADSDESTFEED